MSLVCVRKIESKTNNNLSVYHAVLYTEHVPDISSYSTKALGDLGESAAAKFLREQGFSIVDKNVVRKTGEIDLIARKGGTLHFVEVKARLCKEFPYEDSGDTSFDPSANLHNAKISKIVRTAQWYVAEKNFDGEWQVDGLLVWLRGRDGAAYVSYLPQIV